MRLERVGEKQMKIHVTADELAEIGLSGDDVGRSAIWETFFLETVSKAKDEWDFPEDGTIFIDVYSVRNEEYIFVLTISDGEEVFFEPDSLFDGREGPLEPGNIHFCFDDVEEVIQLAKRLYPKYTDGDLIYYDNRYHLIVPVNHWNETETLKALFAEYGDPSSETIPFLMEYGKKILDQRAIYQLNYYFAKI